MNTNLSERILNRISGLSATDRPRSAGEEEEDKPKNAINLNDPVQLLTFVESRVTSLDAIWRSVTKTMKKTSAESAKNARLAEAHLAEAEYRLEGLIDQDQSQDYIRMSKAKRREELNAILDLIDLALVNTPNESQTDLAKAYALRAAALGELADFDAALANIERAIRLAPDELLYFTYKTKYFINAGRWQEALQMIAEVMARCRSSEEAGVNCVTRKLMTLLEALHEDVNKQLALNDKPYRTEKEEVATESNVESPMSGSGSPEDHQEDGELNFTFDDRCLIETSAEKGRHMIAVDDIESGKLIFKEKAYSVVLCAEYLLHKCHYCGHDVSRHFWPCTGCNTTVYCNEHCAESDWSLNHAMECHGSRLTRFWTNRSMSQLHVFRLLNRIGLTALFELMDQEQKNTQMSAYDLLAYMRHSEQQYIEERHKDPVIRVQAYQAWLSLQHNSHKFRPTFAGEHLVKAIECAIMTLIVQGYSFDTIPRHRLVTLIAHCFYGLRRVLCNAFRWSQLDDGSSSKNGQKFIGSVLCLLSSTLNHSCEPNADWSISEGILYLYTNKPVVAGEEISITYGPNRSDSFARRQETNASYFFQCKCALCVEDASWALALGCLHCSGPVLITQQVFDPDTDETAPCLLCETPMADAADKRRQLLRARQDLYIISQLLPNLSGLDKGKYLGKLRDLLADIRGLIYGKSHLLVHDIYAVCQVLHKEGQLEECVAFGELIDRIMPIDGRGIMSITESSRPPFKHASIPTVAQFDEPFDINLDHLIFWCSTIYHAWIVKTDSRDIALWECMTRFLQRTVNAAQLIIKRKQRQLDKTAIMPKDGFEMTAIDEEIELLKTLHDDYVQQLQQSLKQMSALI